MQPLRTFVFFAHVRTGLRFSLHRSSAAHLSDHKQMTYVILILQPLHNLFSTRLWSALLMCCPCPSGYMEKIEMSSKYTNTKNLNNPWQHYLLGLNNCCSICWSKRDQQIIIVPKISFTFIHFLNVHQVISTPKIKLRKNLSTPPQVEKLNWLVVKGICFIGLCCLVSSSPCITGKFYPFSLKRKHVWPLLGKLANYIHWCSKITNLSHSLCLFSISALQGISLCFTGVQVIYTTRHKHLRSGMNLI